MAAPKMAMNRMKREIADIRKDKQAQETGVKVIVDDDSNILNLKGEITGPPDTPYHGGRFQLSIEVPESYPFNPPKVKFVTKIWHPNISSQTGAICLDILTEKAWAAAMTLRTVLLSIQALLASAEPDDPQDAVVAGQYKRDKAKFDETARYWTVKYAEAEADESTAAKDAMVAQVMDVGVTEEKAREALSTVGWNVQHAIEKLFN